MSTTPPYSALLASKPEIQLPHDMKNLNGSSGSDYRVDKKKRSRSRSTERVRDREKEKEKKKRDRSRERGDSDRKRSSRNREKEREERERERRKRDRERERRESPERERQRDRDVRSHRSNSRGNDEQESRRRRRDRRERTRSRSYDKRRGDRYRREHSRSRDRNSRDRNSRDRNSRDRNSRDRERSGRRRSTSVDRERDRMERERESRMAPIREETNRFDLTQSIQELMNSTTSTKNFAALFNCANSNDSFSNVAISENSLEDANDRKRKKKSRWGGTENDKTFIPGMPTILPSTLDPSQQEAYLVQLQIEEISRKLRTGDLGIPQNLEERSPSPEPIYSSDGKRLNTREFRFRKRLEEQRHQLIQKMQSVNPEFKPPADYKPPVTRVSDKVLIPQEMHPDINFVGLLIGPRGNTLKAMEKETGAKIIIRGKGSVKEGKVGRKDGQPLPGEDEPLHAFITAPNPEAVKRAVDKIKDVIRQGIEVPEGHNDLRRMQLRELAQLNGTLRETDCQRCSNCGSMEHKSWLCPDKPNITNNIVCTVCGGAGHISKDCRISRPGGAEDAGENPTEDTQAKIDEEYMSLMAELGEGPPPSAIIPQKPVVDPLAQVHLQRGYSIFDKKPSQMQAIQAPPPPTQLQLPLGPPPPMHAIAPPPPIPPGWGSGNMPQNNVQPPPPAAMMPWMQPPPPGGENPPIPGGAPPPPPPGTGGGLQPPGTGPMPPLIPPPPGTSVSSAPLPPWSPPANLMPPGFGNWSPGNFMPPPPPCAPPPPGLPLSHPPPPPPPA